MLFYLPICIGIKHMFFYLPIPCCKLITNIIAEFSLKKLSKNFTSQISIVPPLSAYKGLQSCIQPSLSHHSDVLICYYTPVCSPCSNHTGCFAVIFALVLLSTWNTLLPNCHRGNSLTSFKSLLNTTQVKATLITLFKIANHIYFSASLLFPHISYFHSIYQCLQTTYFTHLLLLMLVYLICLFLVTFL